MRNPSETGRQSSLPLFSPRGAGGVRAARVTVGVCVCVDVHLGEGGDLLLGET